MVEYVIPARKGSKRFPKKNRKLLSYTLDILPEEVHERTVITTDDPWIWDYVSDEEFKVLKRDTDLADDEASMRSVLIDVAEQYNFENSDDFVLLYLTYPGRKYSEVKEAIKFYNEHEAKSLLCRQPVKSHPYLCMHAEENNKGSQIIDHELYRYQDYPEVFELSHYISIMEVGELSKLNLNLYNEETVYFPIGRNVIDVDHKQDFNRFLEEYEST